MLYNNGFPAGYPYFQQVQPQVQQQPQQMMTPPTIHAEIIQVDGEQAATNYPVGAGASQMMIARDDSAIFVKTAAANGTSTLDVYVRRPPAPPEPPIDLTGYVTRDELERRLSALTGTREANHEPV